MGHPGGPNATIDATGDAAAGPDDRAGTTGGRPRRRSSARAHVPGAPDPPDPARRQVVARYGGRDALLARGFTPVANLLLRYGARLKPSGLTPTEMAFVIHLLSHKWDARRPFPAFKTVARRMGVSVQYARRIARNLDRKGLLTRVTRVGSTNLFDLTPLFDRLAAHAASRDAARRSRAAGGPEGRAGRADDGPDGGTDGVADVGAAPGWAAA